MKTAVCFLFLIVFSIAVCGQDGDGAMNRDPEKAAIVATDIDLFWNAYDAATPENDLIIYRDRYLRQGSTGLKEFHRLRIESVCDLVAVINARPGYYSQLRAESLKVKTFEPAIRSSFRKLKRVYPDAVFPPVYFVVGRMNSGGTLSEKGLLIGVDMYGKTDRTPMAELSDWLKAVLGSTDRLPYIVAHELIHYQQSGKKERTLLAQTIHEGAADFVGELISGGQINPHLHEYGNPREKELWNEFKLEMLGSDYSNWLYQGERSKNRPADLGYYVGYKIVEAYYKRSADKEKALREILGVSEPLQFLEESGYAATFGEQEK